MHRVKIRLLFADVDAMNVVYYGQYLRFFELGRAEVIRVSGRIYSEMAAQGLHLPVTEAHVRYKRPPLTGYCSPPRTASSRSWPAAIPCTAA
ncbi:hypothetical protein DFAR_3690036 [Desulfarculales bacterium]